jgi:hypothetical protein
MSGSIKRVPLRRLCALFLLLGLSGAACQAPPARNPSAGPDAPHLAVDTRFEIASAHDLSQDESAGGHTLRKHVGRSEQQLRERLRHERNIAAASTWADRATAEAAIGTALAHNREKIERWLDRSGGHPNLVVDYNGDPSHPIGSSLRRDADRPVPCAHAVIVLKWAGPHDYYVLTSYPEC